MKGYLPKVMQFKITPWDHQITKGIDFARVNPSFALFWEMGTGKSGATVNVLREEYSRNGFQKTLLLCPLIVVRNWLDEFKKHSHIDPREIILLEGAGKKRLAAFENAVLDHGDPTVPKIVITNYESLQMKDLYRALTEWRPDILVCDESHRLKNPGAVRTRLTTRLADLARRKILLTGTPILNTPMDVFAQYRILDGGKTFGDNKYAFQATYMEDENAGWKSRPGYFPKWIARPEKFPELHEKMYAIATRVLKKDCLDLPPFVNQVREIELGTEQKKMYKEMRDEYITFIKTKEAEGQSRAVVAQLAITKALRLQQIVSGYAKDEAGGIHQLKKNPRLDALQEILEELTPNHKVIVWATFKENYRQIAKLCEQLEIKCTELHGGNSAAEKQRNVETFRKDDACRVIIANQGAAGIGINLVEASYSVFYSRNFSLEHDLQAEARNYRGGSERHKSVTRIDLVARGTIDELILEALSAKQNISDRILDWEI